MEEQLLETWNIHHRINLYLLDAIASASLADISASKGRSVAEQFAHIHNVRLMWLKQAAPELSNGLEALEKGTKMDKRLLSKSLEGSSKAIGALLKKGIDEGKIKGFKPHAVAFMGYLISHESHHRGQIVLTLKQSGHPVDKKIGYGIWEWGVR